jgi:hypothetical protein
MNIVFFNNDEHALNNDYIYSKGVRLLREFLDRDLNNYLKNDALIIGHNWNSGYTYAYLEGMPSINLAIKYSSELVTIYSSWLDGLEFEKVIREETLEDIEELQNKFSNFDEEREEGKLSDLEFINKAENLGWESI